MAFILLRYCWFKLPKEGMSDCFKQEDTTAFNSKWMKEKVSAQRTE
jgi:hypothetical protein